MKRAQHGCLSAACQSNSSAPRVWLFSLYAEMTKTTHVSDCILLNICMISDEEAQMINI